MPYVLLVVERSGDRKARSESEGRALYDRMVQFSDSLKRRGLLTMSQSLTTDAAAVRVSNRDGRSVVCDGPFAEAKEMIGGLLLLTCATLHEAIAIARECPASQWATIEVRELGPCFQ